MLAFEIFCEENSILSTKLKAKTSYANMIYRPEAGAEVETKKTNVTQVIKRNIQL